MNEAAPHWARPAPHTPHAYVGVWHRLLLETPDGVRDTDTQVIWLQTDALYADIRQPAGRPDFAGTGSLAACTQAQQVWLRRQHAFAGTLEVTDDVCRWQRAVDYQPPTTLPDAGRMIPAGKVMVEHGIHVPYREEWQRLQGASDDVIALRLLEEIAPGAARAPRYGLLLALGDFFMFVLDRPATAGGCDTLHHRLSLEVSFGRRRAGAQPWEIVHSTLPWREGAPLVAPGSEPRAVRDDRCEQMLADGTSRYWRVHQRGGAFAWFS